MLISCLMIIHWQAYTARKEGFLCREYNFYHKITEKET